MHLNNISFITMISESVYYGIASTINNIKCDKLEFELKNIVRSYYIRGFRIIMIIIDI